VPIPTLSPTPKSSKAPRHFVEMPLANAQTVKLPTETAHHIGRVTRMRSGEAITLFNGDGNFYHGTLHFDGKTDCSVAITETEQASSESHLTITLLQGLASSEKMAWAIEKATELGVQMVIPVECHRSVAQIRAEKVERKQFHWINIARAASAQCGRAAVPIIAPPISSSNSLQFKSLTAEYDALLVLSPVGSKPLSTWAKEITQQPSFEADQSLRIAVYIGPEGGLEDDEVNFALEHGFQAIRMGPRVLRTETAGPTVIASLQALLGDF
jgi:16S rRNA (uracil1498-N3)-methyltransferase